MRYSFQVGKNYTRNDIYKIVEVPADRRRGNWETGYNKYEDDLFIFCNVGFPGRTGHDYQNHWNGDLFVWKAKEGTHIGQPQIQWMQDPAGDVYLFTRKSDRAPFVFEGLAEATSVLDTTPVTIHWRVNRRKPFPAEAFDVLAPERVETKTLRILRDTALTKRLKALHRNECQLCCTAIPLPGGLSYSEAHHIQPLGDPHNGPDIEGNILVVCPNHHAMCDFGAIRLNLATLRQSDGHQIEQRYIDYHNSHIAGEITEERVSHD